MQQLKPVIMMMMMTVAWVTPVGADTWNDRTILRFSEPVTVPGTTLQPGTYVFRLADAATDRHLVRIYNENEDRLVTTVQAIPMKRMEATNDIAVRFSATETGVPVALKGWFYPGSTYGHQFVYSEEEARQIAARARTLVLSGEQAGTDLSTGTLHTYDAAGIRAPWQRDEATEREWQAWRQTTSGTNAAADATGQSGSSTAIVSAEFRGKRVMLEDLEERPGAYVGQTISVDGEVDQVLGPRLFTLDEPDWADLDGELLVYMPAPLAAFVRDNDRVTVSGTVRNFVKADIEREWGWLTLSPDVEIDLSKKPVIVADRIIGGDNQRALVITAASGRSDPGASTNGENDGHSGAPITTATALAGADDETVGRRVDLNGVKVTGLADRGGFFVASQDRQLFVLPQMKKQQVAVGQMVSIDGTVLQMPERMRNRLNAPGALNRQVYVFADSIN